MGQIYSRALIDSILNWIDFGRFLYVLDFAVTVFGNVKDALMFSKYNYTLKANLVAHCYVPN